MMTKANIKIAYQKLLEMFGAGRCYEVARDGVIATCRINKILYLTPNEVDYVWRTRRFNSKFDEFLTLDEAKKKSKKIRDSVIEKEIECYEKRIKELNKELDKWKKRLSAN